MTGLIPHDDLVFDWLDDRDVPWRVYHSGLSFFLLFGAFGEALGSNFRSIRRLASDFQSETGPSAPKVIFIEPEYEDSPTHLGFAPNDNHPPLPMAPGEAFVRAVYSALRTNDARWQKTLRVAATAFRAGRAKPSPPNGRPGRSRGYGPKQRRASGDL